MFIPISRIIVHVLATSCYYGKRPTSPGRYKATIWHACSLLVSNLTTSITYKPDRNAPLTTLTTNHLRSSSDAASLMRRTQLRAHCVSGQIFSSCREKEKGLDPIPHFRAIIQLSCGQCLPHPPFLDRYHLGSARYNSASNSTFSRMQNSRQLAFHLPTHQGSHQDQAQAGLPTEVANG